MADDKSSGAANSKEGSFHYYSNITSCVIEQTEAKILEAIAAGSIEDLDQIVTSAGSTIQSYRQSDDSTLLHLSVLCGPASLTKELIDRGCDINAQTKGDRSTALHLAATTNRLTTVEILLSSPDIDDTIRDSANRSAMDLVQSKPVEMTFRYARAQYIRKTMDELHRAVRRGNHAQVYKIMSIPRARSLIDVNSIDCYGETILHGAARNRNGASAVRACLEIGVNPFTKNRKGKLPYEVAATDDIKEILRTGTSCLIRSPHKFTNWMTLYPSIDFYRSANGEISTVTSRWRRPATIKYLWVPAKICQLRIRVQATFCNAGGGDPVILQKQGRISSHMSRQHGCPFC